MKNKQRFDIILNMDEKNFIKKIAGMERRFLEFLKSHPKEMVIAMIGLASLPIISLGFEGIMAWGLPPLFLFGSLYLHDKPESSLKK